MSIVKVNRSGVNHKIYETNGALKQIGTLYNNEVFTWTQEWAGSSSSGFYIQGIIFRGSDGKQKGGWVSGRQSDSVFATNICTLAKFTKVINGKTYYGFEMRRDEELYDNTPEAKSLNKVASKGRHILCESSTGGYQYPGRLAVVYLETGIATNKYEEIVKGTHAFVDIGYDQGSMFTSNSSLIGCL